MAASTSGPEPSPVIRVPNGLPRLGWYLASLGIFALLVQVVTGLLLLVHFRPGEGAWDSVAHITSHVPFGWLIRGLHAASSHLLIGVVIVHGIAAFATRAFKTPRESTWTTGVCAAAVVLAFSATGATLPADRSGTVVARIGAHLVAAVPLLGSPLASFIGGTGGGAETMHRYFALHVGFLPLALLGLAAGHVVLVRTRGSSVPTSERDIPWFPDFARREVVLWVVALHAMAALVALSPPELGPRGDALEPTSEASRPAWFFLSAWQLVKILPAQAGGLRSEQLAVTAALLSFVLLLSLPYWAASERRSVRLAANAIIGAWLLAVTILAIWGYHAS